MPPDPRFPWVSPDSYGLGLPSTSPYGTYSPPSLNSTICQESTLAASYGYNNHESVSHNAGLLSPSQVPHSVPLGWDKLVGTDVSVEQYSKSQFIPSSCSMASHANSSEFVHPSHLVSGNSPPPPPPLVPSVTTAFSSVSPVSGNSTSPVESRRESSLLDDVSHGTCLVANSAHDDDLLEVLL
jgi:hypothetical protein